MKQTDLSSDNIDSFTVAQGEIERCVESNTAYRTLGYFGRVNYDYEGRYIFEASARGDGSSRFERRRPLGLLPLGIGRLAHQRRVVLRARYAT